MATVGKTALSHPVPVLNLSWLPQTVLTTARPGEPGDAAADEGRQGPPQTGALEGVSALLEPFQADEPEDHDERDHEDDETEDDDDLDDPFEGQADGEGDDPHQAADEQRADDDHGDTGPSAHAVEGLAAHHLAGDARRHLHQGDEGSEEQDLLQVLIHGNNLSVVVGS